MSDKGETIAQTEVINVRLPAEVVSMLDKLVEKKLYSTKSEAIREFCREYVREARGGIHGR